MVIMWISSYVGFIKDVGIVAKVYVVNRHFLMITPEVLQAFCIEMSFINILTLLSLKFGMLMLRYNGRQCHMLGATWRMVSSSL